MSVREIAERARVDVLVDVSCTYCDPRDAGVVDDGDGALVIERAIREAAKPLVEALEMAEHLLADDPAIHDVLVQALAAWKEGA